MSGLAGNWSVSTDHTSQVLFSPGSSNAPVLVFITNDGPESVALVFDPFDTQHFDVLHPNTSTSMFCYLQVRALRPDGTLASDTPDNSAQKTSGTFTLTPCPSSVCRYPAST